jgi:hypothetical protein
MSNIFKETLRIPYTRYGRRIWISELPVYKKNGEYSLEG